MRQEGKIEHDGRDRLLLERLILEANPAVSAARWEWISLADDMGYAGFHIFDQYWDV